MPATSFRESVLSFTPAVLLIAIATVHQYRTTVSDQSWWGAGAGFAMYTMLDHHGSRTLRVTVHTEDGAHRVDVKSDSAWRARVLPTQANIDALAHELLEARWSEATEADGPRFTRAEVADGSEVIVHRVDVELWRRAFDPVTAKVTTWCSSRASVP